MKTLSLLIASLLLIANLNVRCPVDDSNAYFTGTTRTDVSGKLLHLYKCFLYGHEFWVV